MDYGELLYKAQENNRNVTNKEVRCYKTEFSPPKRIERSGGVSSSNIKKFLAKKEEEEKKKREEAFKRKEELLALRSQDKKAQRRVQTMLRATKSANKSVMEDAVDNVNTRDTLNGFKMCDEDDYGYVSQEAAAFYDKLLNKYDKMPAEPPKFQPAKKEVKDLNAAKDRVKAALQKEAEEELLPHKRKKRKHGDKEGDDPLSDKDKDSGNDEKSKKDSLEEKKKEAKPKSKRPPPPPAMNFESLLKIAEKKQFEPIMIDESRLKKEPERLMTKKEKLEAERMALYKKNKNSRPGESSSSKSEFSSKDESLPKSTKSNSKDQPSILKKTENDKSSIKNASDKDVRSNSKKSVSISEPVKNKVLMSKEAEDRLKKDSSVWSKSLGSNNSDLKNKPNSSSKNSSGPLKNLPKIEKRASNDVPKSNTSEKSGGSKVSDLEKEIAMMKAKQELLMRQLKEKEIAMKKMEESKKKESLERPVKRDKEPEKRPLPTKKLPMPQKKKIAVAPSKRRIASESEEEYDSELDDFIDDGPDEGNEYSKYISEIFGYDKSRYAHENDEDDECMESNFAQISKEEYVSTKIGIMEDLEDIRKEQEEKKRMKEKKLRMLSEQKKKKMKYK